MKNKQYPEVSTYVMYFNSKTNKVLLHTYGWQHYSSGITGYNRWNFWEVFDASIF